MKRGIFVWALVFLMASMVFAQDAPQAPGGVGGEDVEKINELVEDVSLVDRDTGRLDTEKD